MSREIRRICMFGGPGSGKSKMAAKLYGHIHDYPLGLVDEAIKNMAWQNIKPQGFDGVWLFGKQIHQEDIVLRSGGLVVTGGSLFQQVAYMWYRDEPYWKDLFEVAKDFEERYVSMNIFLHRTVDYKTEGRYQKNVEEAKEIDKATTAFLNYHNINYYVYTVNQFDELVTHIVKNLEYNKEKKDGKLATESSGTVFTPAGYCWGNPTTGVPST